MATRSPIDHDFDTSTIAEYVVFTKRWSIKTEEAIKKINSLKISDDNNLKKIMKDYGTALKTAQTSANTVIEAANTFFSFADLDESMTEQINEFYKNGNYTDINKYFDQTKKYLQRIQEVHTEFKEKYELAKINCSITESIDEKKATAQNKKKVTRAIGSGAAVVGAGIVGVGVVLSIVAGVFTFGVGTIVGLSLTGAAAIGTGFVGFVAAGATTYVLAENYKEVEKVFQELAQDFESLDSFTTKVGSNMEEIMQQLTHIEKEVEILKTNHMTVEQGESDATFESTQFSKAFHRILKGIRKGHDILTTS